MPLSDEGAPHKILSGARYFGRMCVAYFQRNKLFPCMRKQFLGDKLKLGRNHG
jgi:hypothetical protein